MNALEIFLIVVAFAIMCFIGYNIFLQITTFYYINNNKSSNNKSSNYERPKFIICY
jgi:hypothetical protein